MNQTQDADCTGMSSCSIIVCTLDSAYTWTEPTGYIDKTIWWHQSSRNTIL